MARDIEEAVLLWKLGQHKEAQAKVTMLRQQNPNNTELLQLACMSALEQKDIKAARDLIAQLRAINEAKATIRGFEVSLAVLEYDWSQAARLLEEEILQDPRNTNIKKDYAYVLTQLKKWPQALVQYEELIKDKTFAKDIIWDYRLALGQVSRDVWFTSDVIQAPESLREYINTQSFLTHINPKLSLQIDSFEELYTKRSLGDTAAIRQRLYGHRLIVDWMANDYWSLGGDWELDYLNGENSNEVGFKADYHREKFKSTIGYDYNHLVRSPLNGLLKEGYLDRLYLNNELALTQRLALGDIIDLQWYRVNPGDNQVTGKRYLGNKYTYDIYGNYRLFSKPYLSMNMHYKRGHWDKTFEEADSVLDFTSDESVYYGGLYQELPLGSLAKFSSSVSRSYDQKRKFYSTLSNASLELWIKKNWKAVIFFEYDLHINGTQGSGNLQYWRFKIEHYF